MEWSGVGAAFVLFHFSHADAQLQLTFTPVLFLLLAIVGGCLTLALGGLAAYHWYLML